MKLSGLLARHFGDHTVVAGLVRNLYREPLDNARVEARLLDSNGGVVEMSEGLIDPERLQPGQVSQFEPRMNPSPDVRSVNVQFYLGKGLLPYSEVR